MATALYGIMFSVSEGGRVSAMQRVSFVGDCGSLVLPNRSAKELSRWSLALWRVSQCGDFTAVREESRDFTGEVGR